MEKWQPKLSGILPEYIPVYFDSFNSPPLSIARCATEYNYYSEVASYHCSSA